MSESDFGKKTSAAESGEHHGKQHRTSFGKSTSRRSSHQRTRATHPSKNRHQKGTTFMKRKGSATALALFITLLFATGGNTKAATFGTGNTFNCQTTFTKPTSGIVTGWGTKFTLTGSVYTLDQGTFATNTGRRYFKSRTRSAVNTPSNQRQLTSNRFSSGTLNTSTASTVIGRETKRFTTPQGDGANFNFTETYDFFDESNQNINPFF
jgi:hypothetical protein